MLKTIGEDSQGKRLGALNSFLASVAVTYHAGEFHYLGNPAAIFFLLDFDSQRQNSLSFPRVPRSDEIAGESL